MPFLFTLQSTVKHAHIFFLSHPGTVNHIQIHMLNAQFVNVIQKVHLLNCVDGNREYSVSLKTARMWEDNGR